MSCATGPRSATRSDTNPATAARGWATERLAKSLAGLGAAAQGMVFSLVPQAADLAPVQSATAANLASPAQYAPAPEQYQKAVAYSTEHYRHVVAGDLWGIAVPLIILGLGLVARYRNWAERGSKRRIAQALVFAPLFLLTLALFSLPVDLWDFSLQRRYGLSVQGWVSWAADWVTSQVLTCLVGTVLIWLLYAVIHRSPRRWWLYFWLAAIPVLLAVFFLQPLVIDPLFFKFTPLQDKHPELVAKLEQVAEHGGMRMAPERMFEMNASSKLNALNAYVTGLGASKRAVIWDTTLAKASTSEVLFVFGHEMGHYVLHHIPKEAGIDALLLLGLMCLGYRLAGWLQARWGQVWGIRGLEDWASLPVLLFVLGLLSFCATPVFLGVSRHFEHEADRYGLEVVHGIVPDSSRAAVDFFQKSGAINLADPNPSTAAKVWFFDHPTRPERIHFAVTYDPWANGKPPRYVK